MKFSVRLRFLRPIKLDPYVGKNTKLPLEQRMYFDTDGKTVVLPSVNIVSFLTAENTKSAPKVLYNKKSPDVLRGMSTFVSIAPMRIPFLDGDNPIVFDGFNEKIHVLDEVARLPKGIPNEKKRVVIEPPVALEFEIYYIENEMAPLNTLKECFHRGGLLVGLGTHRPVYGQFCIDRWEEVEET